MAKQAYRYKSVMNVTGVTNKFLVGLNTHSTGKKDITGTKNMDKNSRLWNLYAPGVNLLLV